MRRQHKRGPARLRNAILTMEALEDRLVLSLPATNTTPPAETWNVIPEDYQLVGPYAVPSSLEAGANYTIRQLVGYYDDYYNSTQNWVINLTAQTYTLSNINENDAGSEWAGRNENQNQVGDLDLFPTSYTGIGSLIFDCTGGGYATITCMQIPLNSGGTIALDRIFHVHSGASLGLENIEVTGGLALDNSTGEGTDALGGGILVDSGASLSLTNCQIVNNFCVGSNGPNVIGTTHSGRQAAGFNAAGGGIYGAAGSTISINGTTVISGNAIQAGAGGATTGSSIDHGGQGGSGYGAGIAINAPSSGSTQTISNLPTTLTIAGGVTISSNLINQYTSGGKVVSKGGTGGADTGGIGGNGGNAYGAGLYMAGGQLVLNGGSNQSPVNFSDNSEAPGPGFTTGTSTGGTAGTAAGAGACITPSTVSVTNAPSSKAILQFSDNVLPDDVSSGLYFPTVTNAVDVGYTSAMGAWNLRTAVAAVNPLIATGMDVTLTLPAATLYLESSSTGPNNGSITLSTGGEGSLQIIGSGESSTIINGSGLGATAFVLLSTEATVSDLTIEDTSTTQNGGAITVGGSTLTLSNDKLLKNTAGMSGGGIYTYGVAHLSLSAVNISSNTANAQTGAGGGIYQSGGSLALKNNSVLANNTSGYGGALWLSNCNFTMSGGKLTDNTATTFGGAMYYVFGSPSAACALTSVTVSGNSSTGGDGGGICATGVGLTLTTCTFTGNTSGDGGAVFVNGASTLKIDGDTITGNTATNGAGIYATTYNDGAPSVKVSAASIASNHATSSGGGLFQAGGSLAVGQNSTVKNNSAGAGGGLWLSGCDFAMSGGQITGDTVTSIGGGAYVFGGSATLSTVTVSNNSAAGGQGGGIVATNAALTLTACTFSGNVVIGDGGAVFVNGTSHLKISGGTISGNKATDGGGVCAMTWEGGKPSAQVSAASISSNSASGSGGGTYQSSGSLKIKGSTVKLNTAGESGGGVWGSAVDMNLTSAVIKSNTVASNGAIGGGGLYLTGGSLSAKGLTILNNTITGPTGATISGGGIYGSDTTISLNGASATAVSLSANYNRLGISSDGTSFSGGGADGGGNAYSSNSLGSALAGAGAFTLGAPDQNDVVSCQGQTITVSNGTYTALNLAAAGVDGNQVAQTFTLNFSDNTSETATQSFSDWCNPQYYTGESILSSMLYRDTSSGGRNSAAPNVYGYSFAIPAGKTLVSVTLPKDSNLLILGMNLTNVAAITTISGNALTASGGSAYGAGLFLTDSTLTTSGLVEIESNRASSTGSSAQLQGGGIDVVSGSSTFGGTLTVAGNSLSGQSGGSAGGAGIQAVSASITVDSGVPWALDANTISGVQDAIGAGINFATGCSFSDSMPNLSGNTVTTPISTSGGSSGPVGSNLAFTVADVGDDSSGATSVSDYTSGSGSLRDAVSWAQSTLLPIWTSVGLQLSTTSSNYVLTTGQPLTIGVGSGDSLVIICTSNNADIQGYYNHTLVDDGTGDLALENIIISGGYANSNNGSVGGGVVQSGGGSLTLVNASVEHNQAIGSHGYHSPTVNTWNNNHTRDSTNGGNASGGGIYQAAGNLYLLGNSVVKSNSAFGGTGGTGTNGNGVAGRTGKAGGDAFGGGIFQTGGNLYLGENSRVESNQTFGGNGGTGGASNSKQGGSGGLAGTAWAGGVDTEQGAAINFPDGYQNAIIQDNVATNGHVGALGHGSGNYAQTSDPSAGEVMNPSNFYHSGQVVSSYQSTAGGASAAVSQGVGMAQSGGNLSPSVETLSAGGASPDQVGFRAGGSMPGVTVELFNAQGGLVATAVSGLDGRFNFRTQFTGMGYCEVVPTPAYEIAALGMVTDAGVPSSFDPASGRTALVQFYEGQAVNQDIHLVLRQITAKLETGSNYVQLVNLSNDAVIWRDQLAASDYKGGFTYSVVDVGGVASFVVVPKSGAASPIIIDGRTGAITFIQGEVPKSFEQGFTVITENLTGNDGVPDLLLARKRGDRVDVSVIDAASDTVVWRSKRTVKGGVTISFDTYQGDTYDANVVLTSRHFDKKRGGYAQKVISGETGKRIASGFTPNLSATPINKGPFTTGASFLTRIGRGGPQVSVRRRRERPR